VVVWRPAQSTPLAWVSLDATDNDPSRFWAYVLDALGRSGVAVAFPAFVAVERDGHRPPEVTLAPLLNSMAELRGEQTLVLDDYHTISSPEIHEELAFLIRHLPPRLRLILLTRSEPPFPLARWRASGDLADIRARDLAFSRKETECFLSGQGIALPDALLGRLCARLEGWAAALRLVSLWVAGRDDPAGRIAEFVASDATIADYLTGEVLDHLSVARRRFLLRTSILGRLTGPLCDAVTGEGGGAETLRELERDQLFVEAIDPGRQWFRYHQLFEELLRYELSREHPELVGELHRRACGWLGAHGFTEEAIDHGLAAGDWASVQGLMLREALALGTRYSPGRVGDWLSVLPEAVIEASPFFLVIRAFVDSHAGRVEDGKANLGAALAIVGSPGYRAELPEMTALIYLLLLGAARLECDLVAARSYGQRTRTKGSEQNNLVVIINA
jgi:LuxR family maltose regulon positive regulatory protein